MISSLSLESTENKRGVGTTIIETFSLDCDFEFKVSLGAVVWRSRCRRNKQVGRRDEWRKADAATYRAN